MSFFQHTLLLFYSHFLKNLHWPNVSDGAVSFKKFSFVFPFVLWNPANLECHWYDTLSYSQS